MTNEQQKGLEFLQNNKGYLKKGNLVVQKRLQKERIWLSLGTIAELKKQVKEEDQPLVFHGPSFPKEEPQMRIKSKWQAPNGDWRYSYKTDETIEASTYNEEAIKAYIEKNVTVSPVEAPEADNEFMLNIYTTDKHIGADTARNSIYSNDYGREEIFDRHEKLVEQMLLQKNMFGTFKKCVFYDLGDALDGNNGQTVRGGHNLPQNMDGREQIDTFIEVTIQTIEQLIQGEIAEEIWFIATSVDNHAGAYGHGALRSVQLYLQAKYPDIIKTMVTSKVLDHITFGEHTFIFGHGKDDSDMKNGMPLNLDLKTELFINDYIDRKRIRSSNIHVVKGDLHQSSINYGKRFRYVNNMSMYGASKWIHTNFGSGASGVDYEIVSLNTPDIYRNRIVYQHDN